MHGVRSENLDRIKNIKHQFLGRKGGTSPRPWNFLNVAYGLGDVDSRVSENRTRICASLGVLKTSLYLPKQVHGVNAIRILKTNDSVAINSQEADAVWTTEPRVLVGVQTADCAPILFASEDGKVAGAIHAGWRGAVADIAVKVLSIISKDLDLAPKHFRISIGPCIGFDSFEVGSEVIDEVKKMVEIETIVKESKPGYFFLNLAGLIKLQLNKKFYNHVEIINQCTYSNPQEYFSYRQSKGKCGRQFSGILLE
ncbi:MAG: peptidoglycan editing factor PgeF [bacterium]|nr:peptidoglycan editing factor PgeF [bacterium]